MDNGNHVGGSGNGGFHSYRKSPQLTPAHSLPLREQRNTNTDEDVHWVINKFGFDDYIEPLPLYFPRCREDDGGECGSLIGESLLKRPMVDTSSSCNITPYHLPPNFPMAHHHFVYPPPVGNGDMQGDASNGSTSQCEVASVDSDVEAPTEEDNE
uniref:Leafy cotyledon1 n=1 Tax=Solanum tuberosum TaxID=4113 RepID=M1B1U7_SOLTU